MADKPLLTVAFGTATEKEVNDAGLTATVFWHSFIRDNLPSIIIKDKQEQILGIEVHKEGITVKLKRS